MEWDGIKKQLTEVSDKNGKSFYKGILSLKYRKNAYKISIAYKKAKSFFSKNKNKSLKITIKVWKNYKIGITNDENVPLKYTTNYVRLDGPFITELPKNVKLLLVGCKGFYYKVRLAQNMFGFIEKEKVDILEDAVIKPENVITYCIINGDDKKNEDIIFFPLTENVPFSIIPQVIDGRNYLYIDFFNTELSTTWLSKKNTAKILGSMKCEVLSYGWVRYKVPVKSKLLWGYKYSLEDKKLYIYVKRPPKIDKNNVLKDFIIAIEPGHGDFNTGAIGTMGYKEKNINRMAAEYLKKELEKRGAKVIIVRPYDSYPTFEERIKMAEDAGANLLISIHANAAGTDKGYFRVSGTSVFYKYENIKLLAEIIHERMLSLGWDDFGIVGNFNYVILRNTWIPAILIEQAFMTNPYDESRLVDKKYQTVQAKKIAEGIEEFLKEVRK